MHHRRRPHSSSAPPPPSTSALIAASTVYHPSNNSPSLAAAAAGAALRHASTSPTPIDQRTGSILTKRMLKRRDSYSSAISDSDGGVRFGAAGRPGVQRARSGGSLTDRRFRKDRTGRGGSVEIGRRGSAPGASGMEPGTERKRRVWGHEGQEEAGEESNGEYAADDDSGSGDLGGARFGRTNSLRSNGSSSNRSFPTTMRGPIKARKHQRSASASIFNRIRDTSSSSSGDGHRRHSSDSEIPGFTHKNNHKPSHSSGGIARLSSGDYGDSVNSLPSELGSISEAPPVDGRHLHKVPTQILEEDSEDDLWGPDTFGFKKGVGGKTRGIGIQNRKGRSASSPPLLSVPGDIPGNSSPSHAKFSARDGMLEVTPLKHSPPPRSVSPAKSALKNAPGSPAIPATGKIHSDATSGRKARVSFSDEDSIASFTAYSRPPLMGMPDDVHRPLPVFGSVSRGINTGSSFSTSSNIPRTMVRAVLAPSPPPSDSSQESIIGLESALRYPRGQPPLGAAVAVKKLLGVNADGGGNGGEGIRLRKGPLTPPETRAGVPELKLTAPTPGEEKDEVEGALGGLNLEGLPGGFPGLTRQRGLGLEELSGGSPNSLPGERSLGVIKDARIDESVRKDEDEDSDGSGNSIYSDAYEDLAPLNTTNLPGILEVVPLSAVRQRNDSSSSASDPPLAQRTSLPAQLNPPAPEFLIPKTRRRAQSTPVQRQYSSSSSSTVSFSEDDAYLSDSSFRRTRPREKRTGMMTSMRAGTPQITKSSTAPTGGMKSPLRKSERSKSRFSADSDSEIEVQKSNGFKSRFDRDSDGELPATGLGGRLRRSRTDSGDTIKKMVRKKGFWGKVFKKEKKEKGKGKEGGMAAEKEMEAGMWKGKGIILKKAKPTPWAGDTDGVRTVISAGSASAGVEKGLGFEKEMGVGLEGRPIIGHLKKRKKFWRLRRLLGLDD